ncbi:MAG: P-II family nitrogen regulator [Chloroflexi bacterium]|nr:P-II family nitrogen regulator [Chloroflexota bacterium]
MLKIEAVVRPERTSTVLEALTAAGVKGYSYWNITGKGQQEGVEVFTGRGGHLSHRAALPKTIIMTVVPDDMKDAIVGAIIDAARTSGEGAIGDGKIFVTTVEDAVRVRTGESGDATVM